MALGLGNNLIRNGGSLNPDGLSLDLQFATDKTLTARKGPTPVFTRASTATFVGSDGLIQTAAINAPRFDHDPLTLACKGLLIEESRTNLFQTSDDFNNAYWTKTGSSISSDSTTSPSGLVDADKIVEDTSSGAHGVSVSPAITFGIAYTLSFYAKKGERSWIRATVTTGGISTWFDLDNGVLGTVGVGVNASIQSVGNGWYRCVATMTSASIAGNVLIRTQTADGQTTYAGDGTSSLFIWGAQLEAGSFPTSYIPTTTAALARSADVCDVVGADVHPSVGTLVVEFDRRALNSASFKSPGRVLASASATATDYAGIDHNDTQVRTPIRAANATVSTLIFSNTTLGNTKVAVAWASGDSAHVSGGAVRNSTSAAIAFANPLDTISFCGLPAAAISTTISSIRYYKKRLPNAKLQTLTT